MFVFSLNISMLLLCGHVTLFDFTLFTDCFMTL